MKEYVYPMLSRKNKSMRLQVETELQQVKIKDLNDENNVAMFTGSVRGGKAFTAEQKIEKLRPESRN